jgi:hypothetical protein
MMAGWECPVVSCATVRPTSLSCQTCYAERNEGRFRCPLSGGKADLQQRSVETNVPFQLA